jgi:hypothetical protein
MDDISQISANLEKRARAVVAETNLIDIWTAIGATVNSVGSLKMGLMARHLDIDFHLYTNPFSLADSFSAMARLAENPGIKSISYTNLLEAEDQCLEWHAFYLDKLGETWQLDLIHILSQSTYAWYFEKVADRITAALTHETRQAILTIKYALNPQLKVMGITVYRAVIEGGVRDLESFLKWRDLNPDHGIVAWMP